MEDVNLAIKRYTAIEEKRMNQKQQFIVTCLYLIILGDCPRTSTQLMRLFSMAYIINRTELTIAPKKPILSKRLRLNSTNAS